MRLIVLHIQSNTSMNKILSVVAILATRLAPSIVEQVPTSVQNPGHRPHSENSIRSAHLAKSFVTVAGRATFRIRQADHPNSKGISLARFLLHSLPEPVCDCNSYKRRDHQS